MSSNLRFPMTIRTKSCSLSSFGESDNVEWMNDEFTFYSSENTVRDIIMRNGPSKIEISDGIRLLFRYKTGPDNTIISIIIYDDNNDKAHIVQSKEMFFSELWMQFINITMANKIYSIVSNDYDVSEVEDEIKDEFEETL